MKRLTLIALIILCAACSGTTSNTRSGSGSGTGTGTDTPAEASPALTEALAHIDAGRVDDARALLTEALDTDEGGWAAYHLGVLDEATGDLEAARAHYATAMSAGVPAAFINHTRLALRDGEGGDAILAEMGDAAPPEARIEALTAAGRFDEAHALARALIDADPDAFSGPYYEAFILTREGERRELAADILLELGQRFDRPEGYRLRGALMLELGDAGEAWQDLERALELRPSDPEAHLSFAALHAREHRFDKATEHLDAATRAAPALAEPHLLRAHILWRQGQHDAATQALLAARALAPEHPHLLHTEALLAVERAATPEDIAQACEALDALRHEQTPRHPACAH